MRRTARRRARPASLASASAHPIPEASTGGPVRYLTLLGALVLCAAASTVLTVAAPTPVALLCVGSFLLFTPGLLVVHVLALPDRLLALVVGLVVGPSLWVLVGTLQLFAGLWAPRATVLWSAGLLGLATLALAARGVRREAENVEPSGPRAPLVERYVVDESDS